jgi:hypothetical protein
MLIRPTRAARAQRVGDKQLCLGRRDRLRDGLVHLGVRERQQRHHHTGQGVVLDDQVGEDVVQVVLVAAQETDAYLGAGAGCGRHVGDALGDVYAFRPGGPGNGDHQCGTVGRQRELVRAAMPPGPAIAGGPDRKDRSRVLVSAHISAS